MGFKKNLLKKIEIDTMTETVKKSLGDLDSGVRIDKPVMRQLLQESPYEPLSLRDLELYLKKSQDDKPYILVLDNDLPIYHTTPEDVALRKSPSIKEMISIKNARKILNDSKVIISRKEASLDTVKQDCLDGLDLSFEIKDIELIEKDGIASFEKEYLDGIQEALSLFAEILGLKPLPKRFQREHHYIFSRTEILENAQYRMGPVLMYGIVHNTLLLYDDPFEGTTKQIADFLTLLAEDRQKPHYRGTDVFKQLTQMAMAMPQDNRRINPKP